MNQLSYYSIHLLRQNQVKEQVKKQLLATISLSSLDMIDAIANKDLIQWEDPGKEFYLHGQLYDVARIMNRNGRIYLYCLNDKKEEQLLENLSNQVKASNDAANDNGGRHVVKFQIPDFVVFSNEMPANHSLLISKEYAPCTIKIVSSFREVVTPPPDFFYV
jgi:hypothetical protein